MPSERELIAYELLVVRCRRGDTSAPGELVAQFQRPLLYYLRRLLPSESDAWDVSQETWVSVFRALDKLREPRTLAGFVYTVARRAAFAHLRRRKLDVSDALDATADDEASVEDDAFAREDAARLHAALGRLSLAHRDVLTLHFLQDLSIEQIADVVGAPAGTIKSRIHHAKRALRALLDKTGGES